MIVWVNVLGSKMENVTDDTNTNEHVYALRLSEMVVCK